jgi:hypothetical protein
MLLMFAVAGGLAAQGLLRSFEVASIKPDKSETGGDRIRISHGSLTIQNVSLKRCIGLAYGIAEGREFLLARPDWLDTETNRMPRILVIGAVLFWRCPSHQ